LPTPWWAIAVRGPTVRACKTPTSRRGRRARTIGNIVVGIIGSFVGGFLASFLFGGDVTGFNVTHILVSLVGAVVFLLILRAIPGKQPFER